MSNSLDPDHDQQKEATDLGCNCKGYQQMIKVGANMERVKFKEI